MELLIIALVVSAWMGGSDDLVATSGRSAVRSAARGGWTAAASTARTRWARSARVRSARAAARRVRWAKTRSGQIGNLVVDGGGAILRALGRALVTGLVVVGAAGAAAVREARPGWRAGMQRYRDRRSSGRPSRRQRVTAWARRRYQNRSRRRHPTIPPATPVTDPSESAQQDQPKEPTVADTKSLTAGEIPTMSALAAALDDMKTVGSDTINVLSKVFEAARALIEALAFDAGEKVTPALVALREATPDPAALTAFMEMLEAARQEVTDFQTDAEAVKQHNAKGDHEAVVG